MIFATAAMLVLCNAACDKTDDKPNGKNDSVPAAAGTITGPSQMFEGYSLTLSIEPVERAVTYKWYKDGEEYQNTASRELTVTETGVYRVAGVNRFGEGVYSPDKAIALSDEPALIDRMVGQWDVKEYIANPAGAADRNDHVITIEKVDAKTIRISNFTWRNYPADEGDFGDSVKAEIDNEAGTMLILPPAELVPSWYADCATLLSPALDESPSQNMGKPFPLQTIKKNGNGRLEMVMKTGNLTKSLNLGDGNTLTVPITCMVMISQMDAYMGTMSYYLDTTWTKKQE